MLHCSMAFQLESSYTPRGDQGQAIAKLVRSVEAGNRHQTLLGVTGSGKTFSIANVIRKVERNKVIFDDGVADQIFISRRPKVHRRIPETDAADLH